MQGLCLSGRALSACGQYLKYRSCTHILGEKANYVKTFPYLSVTPCSGVLSPALTKIAAMGQGFKQYRLQGTALSARPRPYL